MKPKSLLWMLGLALVMGVLIFFERDLPSTEERAELETKVLPIDASDVQALTLVWPGNEVRLQRQEAESSEDDDAGAEWHLTAPLATRADGAAVEGLLQRLLALTKMRTLEEFEPAKVGLAEPRATAVLATDDAEWKIALGAELPLSDGFIVGREGLAFQVPSDGGLFEEWTRPVGDWRDPKLFHAKRDHIQRLVLASSGQRVELVRRGADEAFDLESPLQDVADRDRVSGLLATLIGLEAASFVDPPAALVSDAVSDGAPSEESLEVTLAGRDEPLRLRLLSNVEGSETRRYAQMDDLWVEIDNPGLLDAVRRPVADWRSTALSHLQVFNVEQAELTDASGVVELSREGGSWLRGEDRIDYTHASDVLYAVAESKAEQVLDRASAEAVGHSLASPRLTLRLSAKDVEEVVRLYSPVAGYVAAVTGEREAVLLLPAERLGEIESKLAALRAAEPLADEPVE